MQVYYQESPAREMQASVAGFCLSTFFAILLFSAGTQFLLGGDVWKIIFALWCLGASSAFAFLALYCAHSIYHDVRMALKK